MMDDKEFEDYAKEMEKEAQEKAKNKGQSSGTFEKVKYTGLVPNQVKIIRAFGGCPNSGKDKFTARTARVTSIIADNGKKFRVILPERLDNESHIIWKIISRVNDSTYVDKKRVFVNETKHPDIFNLITKNGLVGKQAMFDDGWAGKTMFIMNCIDREMMDWHRANKHLVLLSKNVNVGDNGIEWATEGVPAYGFMNLITTGLFKFYKDWRGYDMGITRLGLKETPYRIINASKYFEEVPAELQKLISKEPNLTEEELSWTPYDLDKLFGITSYTKIYNRLKLTIAKIDATLGTQYLKELEYEVEKEKANAVSEEDEPANEASSSTGSYTAPSSTPSTPAAAPTRNVRASAPAASDNGLDPSTLKGWSGLTDDEKSRIQLVVTDKGTASGIKVTYDTRGDDCPDCPTCLTPAPITFGSCPNCGMSFN